MSDNENGGGGGCLMTILAAGLLFVGLLAMVGGDTSTVTTSTDTRSGVLSGNQAELLSRNQLNILSDVWNCFGDGSCIITTELMTNTLTRNEVLNLDGDRNTVTSGGGGVLRMCTNAEGWGYQTYEPCGAGYSEAQP